jgi:DNA-binding NarL/FixJ family response regulator
MGGREEPSHGSDEFWGTAMNSNKAFHWTWGESPAAAHNGFPIHLTPRQREVLLLLCAGLPNKVIGRRLGLSDATVKCHVASLLRSLNVATRLEAVAVAFQLGLVQPGTVPDEERVRRAPASLDLGVALAA